MARDHRSVITSLLLKTMSRGATAEEERSARAKAEELSAKYGVPLADCTPPDPSLRARASRAYERAKETASSFEWTVGRSIAEICEILIVRNHTLEKRKRWSNEKIASFVRHLRPGARTSATSVAWYASQMRKRQRT